MYTYDIMWPQVEVPRRPEGGGQQYRRDEVVRATWGIGVLTVALLAFAVVQILHNTLHRDHLPFGDNPNSRVRPHAPVHACMHACMRRQIQLRVLRAVATRVENFTYAVLRCMSAASCHVYAAAKRLPSWQATQLAGNLLVGTTAGCAVTLQY